MAELRDQEATTLGTADLDDSELLGFEWLEPQRDEDARTEQAIGIIFNKRGLGACPRNGGFWWRRLRESDSACL